MAKRRPFAAFMLAACLASWAGAEVRIAGRVLDVSGVEVEHGLVELRPLSAGLFAEPVASAAVVGGRFELTAPDPGWWRLIVRAPSFTPAMATLEPLLFPTVLPPAFLPPDLGAEVDVVDAAGLGLEGVSVRAVPGVAGKWPQENGTRWRPAPRSGMTDSAGRLLLARGPGETLDFSALAPGRGWSSEADAKSWRVVLRAVAAVGPSPNPRRSLAEKSGQKLVPVRGAEFFLEPGEWRLGPSDESGRLPSFAAEGSWHGRVALPDGRRQSLEIPAQGSATLALQHAVSGQVVDRQGQPIRGAFVMRPESTGHGVRTDDEGRFTLFTEAGESFGGLRLLVATPFHMPRQKLYEPGPDAEAIVLDPAAAVAGRVLDAESRPQSDVELTHLWQSEPTFTDGAGRFFLGGLGPERRIGFSLSRKDLRRLDHVLEPLRDFEIRRGIELRMDAAALLAGRVVDPQGHPVPAAKVEITGSFLRRDGEHSPTHLGGGDGALEAITGPDGRFAAALTAEGLLDLEVHKEGFTRLHLRSLAVTSVEGRFDLGEIALERSAPFGGLVVERSVETRPVEGAEIYLFSRTFERFDDLEHLLRSREPEAVTGKDGRFFVDGLHAGEAADLIVHHPDFARAIVHGARASDEQILVRLDAAARLSGRVVNIEGEGVSWAEVFLRPPFALGPSGGQKARSEREGAFAFAAVPHGDVELRVRAAGFPVAVLALQVSGNRDDLRVELPVGFRVTGTVFDPSGAPIRGAAVRLRRPEGFAHGELEPSRLAHTDANGHFTHTGVGVGEWRLVVRRHGLEVERPIQVAGHAHFEIVLDGPGESLAGAILDESGRGLEGIRLQLVGEGDGPSAISGAGGFFRIQRVEAGTYRLRTAFSPRQGGRAATLVVEPGPIVVDGDPETVEPELKLILGPGAILRGRVLGLRVHELARVEIAASGERAMYMRQRIPVDAEARFEVAGLAVGRWRLVATLSGTGQRAFGEVEILAEQKEAWLELDFARGLTLGGQVVADGAPLAGIAVVVTDIYGLDERIRTDSDGRFRVTGLDSGTLEVRVELPGAAIVRKLDLVADAEMVIDLLD